MTSLQASAAGATEADLSLHSTAVDSDGAPKVAPVVPAGKPPARPVIASFHASPETVTSGAFTTLTWRTENATSVAISPESEREDGQPLPISGRTTGVPLTTTVYTLTATGPGGSVSRNVTVNVNAAPPSVQLFVTPNQLAPGQSATLTWHSDSATSVTIDNGIGTVEPSGSKTISPPASTTYTATATDTAGTTATASADVALALTRPTRPPVAHGGGSFSTSIKHIIFFVQENRSFDNYFGKLGQYRASKGLPASDIDGIPSNAVQYDENGVAVHPYHQQTICAENTSPSWNPSWHAYNGGKMDGFVSAHDLPTTLDPEYHRAMAYYTQTELPYYYELATQFATSDRFFASVLSGTIPNRMYLFGATSAGHIFPDPPPSGGFPIRTIFENLRDAGVSWRYYYLDNSIFLAQFEAWNDPAIRTNVYPISNYYSVLADSNADNLLPQVIFIERGSDTCACDEHPDANTQTGAATGAQLINALLASPAWKSSVFIHTYDEFGGLYDHVAPFSVPAPDNIQPIASPGYETPLPGDFAHSDFRIPLMVISPWVKPNFVSHTPRELTSILKLIETRFNLPSLTARDAAADNMLEFFDFSNPHWLTPPTLPTQATTTPCDFSLELAGQN